jgi:hypothetical protein
MNKDSETNILLTLLIILTVLSFSRTLVYIIFDHNLFAIDQRLGFDSELIMQGILTIFAVLRLLIASLILYKKHVKVDLISVVLIYLIFTSFLRFYYEYEYFTNPKSKVVQFIDRYQDINAVAIFLSSAYIMYFIFLQ